MNDLLDTARHHFESQQFEFTTIEELDMLALNLRLQRLLVFATVGASETAVDIRLRLPLVAPDSHRGAVAEFFHRLNETCWHIHWLIDPDDGTLTCRQLIDCTGIELTDERFGICFVRTALAVDGMTPVVARVVAGELSPAAAVEQAHGAAQAFAAQNCPKTTPPPQPPHLWN